MGTRAWVAIAAVLLSACDTQEITVEVPAAEDFGATWALAACTTNFECLPLNAARFLNDFDHCMEQLVDVYPSEVAGCTYDEKQAAICLQTHADFLVACEEQPNGLFDPCQDVLVCD